MRNATLPRPTETAEPPTNDEPDLDASLRLGVAVEQLCQPGVQTLDRSRAEHDDDVAVTEVALARRHALERRRLGIVATPAWFVERHRRDVAALRVARVATPCLLDQLAAAVTSPAGTGHVSRGVHRAPIKLAAAELLGHIERGVGHRPPFALTMSVRRWAGRIEALDDTGRLAEAADQAQRWAAEAHDVVTPRRAFEVTAPCPACGTVEVWQPDDTGQRTKRAALQVEYATRSARCIAPGCTARWPEGHLEHLARVLSRSA